MGTNWNQLIERYLNNELSAEGKAAFETELERNAELQAELELHKLTRELIQRNSLRTLVKQSGKWFHLKKILVNSGIALIAAGVLAAAVYFIAAQMKEAKTDQPALMEKSMIEKLDQYLAFDNIDPQYFQFTGESDVFLSESGVLLSLTDKSFLLNGKPYKGEAVVQWQEVQNPSEIVKAGLSTMSGDRLLETQGMFSLNAFTPDGKKLELSKEGAYIQVPVDEVKNGMKLFEGVPQADGKVDWQNPVELERLPKPKSMANMDLFPPKYEPKLDELKWATEKKKRDSLYLSFEEGLSGNNEKTESSNPSLTTNELANGKPALKKSIGTINPFFNSKGDVEINNPKYTFVDHPSATRVPYSTVGISSTVGVSKGDYYNLRLVWSMLDDDHVRLLVYGEVYLNKQLLPQTFGDLFGLTGDYSLLKITELKSEQEVVNGVVELAAVYDVDLKKKGDLSEVAVVNMKTSTKTFSQKIDIAFKKRNSSNSVSQANDGIDTSPKHTHLPPSKVLAIWDKKFDNTILATQEFEDRMKLIHQTCDEKVFDVYAKNLNEPLWKLDERVVKMGHKEFQALADQRIGKVKLDDAHQKNLASFYEEAVKQIREKGKQELETALKKERQWDNELEDERNKEVLRKGLRESANLNEEYGFNLRNVYRQLGVTAGFQMHGGGTIVNIDKYVWDATVARQSTLITDPVTGKTAQITYEPLTVEVKEPAQYDKLFIYLFSREINSYQRLDFKGGKLNYNLNGDMNYSAALVGMNEKGYFYHQINELKAEDLGILSLEKISEKEFDKRINILNDHRTDKAMSLKDELKWLFKEQANYKVLQKRRENAAFRAQIRPTIYSCGGAVADTIGEIIDEL